MIYTIINSNLKSLNLNLYDNINIYSIIFYFILIFIFIDTYYLYPLIIFILLIDIINYKYSNIKNNIKNNIKIKTSLLNDTTHKLLIEFEKKNSQTY